MKFLAVSVDEKTSKFLKRFHDIHSVFYKSVVNITEEPQEFQRGQFNVISKIKMEAVYGLLLRGHDVIFIDTDVVLVNDPTDILIWDHVDYVHGINARCQEQ